MSFYWCIATKEEDNYWTVLKISDETFVTISDCIENACLYAYNWDVDLTVAKLLIGRNHAYIPAGCLRWLLVTDYNNFPCYIVKSSHTVFANLQQCEQEAKNQLSGCKSNKFFDSMFIVFEKK